jgi:hypothetical protein
LRSAIKIAELREQALRHTVGAVAWVAGLSESSVERFRKGADLKADALKKIRAALIRLRNGLTIATAPGPLHVDSGKPWQGRTTVREVTRGKRCGWCGGQHDDSFDCE